MSAIIKIQNMNNLISKHTGYSLPELMVSIAIMAILAAMAAPSMQSYIARQQMRTFSQELIDSLLIARSEALANGISYRLSPQSSNWNNGWVSEELTTGDPELFKQYNISNNNIALSMAEGDTVNDTVTFNGNGRANTLTRFQVSYAHTASNLKPYCITIAASGNIDVSTEECSAL